ncbi:ribonuclease H-like domain-containing protein [Tanacetum coccineum]
MYVHLENIVPLGGLACLIAKATSDESNLWHRRLGHVNFKNLNRLVKGNLVRGLPTKLFQNDHTCVACQKGRTQASCNAKLVSTLATPTTSSLGLWIKRDIAIPELHNKGVAERKDRNLFDGSKTMLAVSFLPNTFWVKLPLGNFAGKIYCFEVLTGFVFFHTTLSSKSDEMEMKSKREEQVFLDDLARLQARERSIEEAEALIRIMNKTLRKEVTQRA